MASLVPGDFLRVLLVSTEETVRNQVGDALAGRAGEHRLYWVSQPDLAQGRARDLEPHIILLDDEALGARTSNLIGDLVSLIPDAGIILLSSPDAMGLARQAILAGARGFVSKPVDSDDLLGAIRQVLSRRGPMPEMQAGAAVGRVVVFCAPKGGTGRTTLAINTSISLQQVTKQAVVLVDADYAAPAIDVALNLRGERDISELRPKMSQLDRDLVASVLAQHESGMSVLLAPPPADLTTPFSLPQVQQVLVWLRRMFPWVVVDLGLPLDDTAFAFLDSADLICMSALPEMIGLRNTRLMFDQLTARGYPEDKIWLILNRRGLPGGVKQDILEEWLGRRVRYAIPNDQVLATDTINRGVPFVLSHKRSAVAKASFGLAREIAQALPGEMEAGVPIVPMSAAHAAPPPAKRHIGFLKPALASLLALLILLLIAWNVFPSLRRGLFGGREGQPTAVAVVAPISEVGTSTTEPGATRAAPSAGAAQEGEATSSAAVAVNKSTQAIASPLAESSATPTETQPIPTRRSSPVRLPTQTKIPTLTSTPKPSPTLTATLTPTATPTPTVTATRPVPTRATTRVIRPLPSPTVAARGLKAPSLGRPGPGEAVSGKVTFTWQPAAALPPGTAYEVVTWNLGEDPSAARGVAATTTGTQLTADLDALYNFGQVRSGEIYWTVLIVRTEPYERVIQPSAGNARPLAYQPPSGGPDTTPEPPIP